jgi:hypothetical protein
MFGNTPPSNELYRDSCVALIDDLGLTDAAVLEGRIEDMVQAYHSGSIVALTSISEGFPYTVVEAMACGRTVVCTNVGGVAEAVGDAGVVVPPRDHVAVAQGCLRLLENDELRSQLALRARERVLERFTLAQSLDAYRNLYERLADPGLPAEHTPLGPRKGTRYVGHAAILRNIGTAPWKAAGRALTGRHIATAPWTAAGRSAVTASAAMLEWSPVLLERSEDSRPTTLVRLSDTESTPDLERPKDPDAEATTVIGPRPDAEGTTVIGPSQDADPTAELDLADMLAALSVPAKPDPDATTVLPLPAAPPAMPVESAA